MNPPSNPLTRDAFLQAGSRLPLEECPLPAPANGTIWVRALSSAERDDFEESLRVRNGDNVETNLANIRAKLVVLTACDHQGNRLLRDEDLDAVGRMPAKVVDVAFSVAQRLAGFTKDEVERLAKKSEKTAGTDSGTDSPLLSAAPSAS